MPVQPNLLLRQVGWWQGGVDFGGSSTLHLLQPLATHKRPYIWITSFLSF